MNSSSSALFNPILWLVLFLEVTVVNLTTVSGMTQVNKNDMEETYYDQPLTRYGADFVDCQGISEIVFLSFFPCLRQNHSGFNASENISECDLLAEAAAHLAVERVNRDPNILPNITLRLYPIYVPSRRDSQEVSTYTYNHQS